ncbi:uncharacterized protein LY79DRAFT_552078 [Colletotrichum navitas]|uniref:Uncharacterized protein n=1 Tax=Colletotrichum navitas TaxID=681940 RepID=A0AAD8Q1B1_9PEZI|nr:uncharacterized protein LY79DRAFT_552078 [Colletotrichum navitas]KAK1593501.1 hypothetical protein LY79DRAFT_552078 [Colletotrichum navitas]
MVTVVICDPGKPAVMVLAGWAAAGPAPPAPAGSAPAGPSPAGGFVGVNTKTRPSDWAPDGGKVMVVGTDPENPLVSRGRAPWGAGLTPGAPGAPGALVAWLAGLPAGLTAGFVPAGLTAGFVPAGLTAGSGTGFGAGEAAGGAAGAPPAPPPAAELKPTGSCSTTVATELPP